MRVVIPSRGRSSTIGQQSFALFPDAIVCVDESEHDDYAPIIPKCQLMLHPYMNSLTKIFNFMIDNIEDDIFIVGDDLLKLHCFVGRKNTVYTDPTVIKQVVENAEYVAKRIGAKYFGFSNSPVPFRFQAYNPIKLCGFIAAAYGVIGKDIRYDESITLREDYDFTLQQLQKNRYVYIDTRFHFEQFVPYKNDQPGGLAIYKSSERFAREQAYLKRKWGKYISVYSNSQPNINVQRKQA